MRSLVDIDARLASDDSRPSLYASLSDLDGPLDLDAVGAFLRAAYGLGYCDALRDPSEFPSSLGAELRARLPVE